MMRISSSSRAAGVGRAGRRPGSRRPSTCRPASACTAHPTRSTTRPSAATSAAWRRIGDGHDEHVPNVLPYIRDMPIEGEYEPSAHDWVRDQVAEYEASGGQRANTLRDTGIPIIVVTMRGRTSGKVRKIGLMRVEHDGKYALIASYGGRPEQPGLVPQPARRPARHDPGRPRAAAATSSREVVRRRARRVVPAWGRRVPQLCRVPGEDRPRDPGLRRHAEWLTRRRHPQATHSFATEQFTRFRG